MAVSDHVEMILRHISVYGEPITLNQVLSGDYDSGSLDFPDSEDLTDVPLTAFIPPLNLGENQPASVSQLRAEAYIAAAEVPSGITIRAGQYITRGDKQMRIESVDLHAAGGQKLLYVLTVEGTDAGEVD
jgi:hypothetical protein